MTDGEGKVQIANKMAKEILGLDDPGFQNLELSNLVRNPAIREALSA